MRISIFSMVLFLGLTANCQEQTDSLKVESKLIALVGTEDTAQSAIFTKVEIEPGVDKKLWRRHLENNLPDFIEKARKNKVPPGSYTINVRFIVERDGSISDVKAINDLGYNFAQEAIMIVKTGPKWSPAIQNGIKVRAYKTQPISFVLIDHR